MSEYDEGGERFAGDIRRVRVLPPEQELIDLKQKYRKERHAEYLEREVFAIAPQAIRDFTKNHLGFTEDIVRRPGCLAFPTRERVRAFLLEHLWERSDTKKKNFSHAAFVEACEDLTYVDTRKKELHEHYVRVASESRRGPLALRGFEDETARIQVLEQESVRVRAEVAAVEDAFLSFFTGSSPEAQKLREFSQRTAIEEAVAPTAYTAMIQRCAEGILAIKRNDATPERIASQVVQMLADFGLIMEGVYPSALLAAPRGIAGSSARSLEKEQLVTLRAYGFSEDDIINKMQDAWRNGLTLDTTRTSSPEVRTKFLAYLERYQRTFYDIAAFDRHITYIQRGVQEYRNKASSDTKQEVAKSIVGLLQEEDITQHLLALTQKFFTNK